MIWQEEFSVLGLQQESHIHGARPQMKEMVSLWLQYTNIFWKDTSLTSTGRILLCSPLSFGTTKHHHPMHV